jgi:hypothetical protein
MYFDENAYLHGKSLNGFISLEKIKPTFMLMWQSGLQFGPKDYVKLLKHLEMIGADLNNYATSQAIMHIRSALEIPDELLLDGYLRTCRTIPAFLASIDVPNNFCRLSSSPRTRGSTS